MICSQKLMLQKTKQPNFNITINFLLTIIDHYDSKR